MKKVLAALLFAAGPVWAQNIYPPLVATSTFAGLGTTSNDGTIKYCRDCSATDPCTGSGVGAFALRVNGAWQCAAGGGSGFATPGAGIPVDTDGAGAWVARCLAAGAGISVANACGAAGNFTLSIDTAVGFLRSEGTADPPATCTARVDWYDETDTNERYYCYATNTWTLVTTALTGGAGGGSNSTLTTVRLVDEWTRGASAAATVASGGHGELNWRFSAGAGSAGPGTATTDHPGVFRLTTSTADDSASGFSLIGVAAGNYGTSGDDWEMSMILNPEDAVTSTAIHFGLADAFTSVTQGIRIIYDTDLSHATWIFQVCDSSTSGCQSAGDDTNADTVASTKAPVAGTWQRLRIRFDPTGLGGNPTYYFSVGDGGAMETEKTFCSSGCDEDLGNLPTGQMFIIINVFARAASTVKDLDLDYFEFAITQAFARY